MCVMTAPARLRRLAIFAALGGAACAARGATTGGTGEGDRFAAWYRRDAVPFRRVLQVPMETAWAVLPQVFEELGYPSGPHVYAEERVYVTPTLRINGRLYAGDLNSLYLDCGHTPEGEPAADVYSIAFAIMARLTPQDSVSTIAEVIVDGTARDRVERSGGVPCTGTGRLEAAILQRLEAGVRSATPGTSEPG